MSVTVNVEFLKSAEGANSFGRNSWDRHVPGPRSYMAESYRVEDGFLVITEQQPRSWERPNDPNYFYTFYLPLQHIYAWMVTERGPIEKRPIKEAS